ncbi:nucleotidyltransferase domain-containing protein [Streptomyces umbrinus]|uniref:nucleotidyltransferase domain-containing protein n=1 Tax=Streptomyces umbrinus TaxID=67370 RepID=UPI0033FF75DF
MASVLTKAGMTAWANGGWGINALLEEVTREHSDLDLVVLLPDLPAIRARLDKAGYRTIPRARLI